MPGEFIARNGMISRGNVVVTGSLTTSGSLTTTGTITATTLVVQTITSSISSITGSTNFGSLSTNTHTFTGSMFVTGALYVTTGSVGMGTTSPNYTLHIDSNTSITRFQITNSTTGQGGGVGLQIIQNGLDASITNRSNGYLGFETVGTERMRITSAGIVSINTTGSGFSNPSLLVQAKSGVAIPLQVISDSSGRLGNYYNSDFNASNTGTNLRMGFSAGSGNTSFNMQVYTAGETTAGNLLLNPSYGLVSIGTASPNASYKLTLSGASSGVVAGLALVDTEAYSYSMYTGASTLIFRDITNAAERMRISSAGDVYIGSSTTDKSSRLVVYGTTTDGTTYTLRCYSVGSDALFGVRTDGYLNSGTSINSPYNLVRTGRVMMVDSAGGVGYQSSTRESKTNINNLTDISFLYQLNPVSFNYRKTEEISNTFTDEYNEDLHYGLIADEVEKVNKELVFYNEKNGQKEVAGVEYGKLTAVLIKAIQELTARVQYLENK
jgi:hypothetical protein